MIGLNEVVHEKCTDSLRSINHGAHQIGGLMKIRYYELCTDAAKALLPAMKELLEKTDCFPEELTFEDWKEILKKIILALEFYSDFYEIRDKNFDVETFTKLHKEADEGMALMGKYWHALWD